MKVSHLILGLLPTLIVPLARGQQVKSKQPPTAVETSVCKIVDDPSAYNNKLVKVRGFVRASFEYSVLLDATCPEDGIWFGFADGSGPPELVATVTGKGTPGGRDSNGRVMLPVPVRLVRDRNLEELEDYWAISAKGEACADGPPPALPPDCTTYRVTATFIGRIDGVSKQIHAAHVKPVKRSSRDRVDGKGFGHMGMFDAQIVVQSVEKVVAEDESVIRKTPSKSQ
jgi:hypothetical protein